MKFFNNDKEFKARDNAIKSIKRCIEGGNFDKDAMVELMYMWHDCLQQEVDIFKQCTALLEQIAQTQEEE